jgi:hypothetical protein
MTLQTRDRRALAFLAVSAILTLVYMYWPAGPAPVVAVAPADSVSFTEKRLARLRDTAASVPAKEDVMKRVTAELATRERGLIVADTAAQAQAQLIQIIRRLGRAENPPGRDPRHRAGSRSARLATPTAKADVVGADRMPHRSTGQLILAGIAAQPELVSTTDLRVISANVKDKPSAPG